MAIGGCFIFFSGMGAVTTRPTISCWFYFTMIVGTTTEASSSSAPFLSVFFPTSLVSASSVVVELDLEFGDSFN